MTLEDARILGLVDGYIGKMASGQELARRMHWNFQLLQAYEEAWTRGTRLRGYHLEQQQEYSTEPAFVG